MRMTSVFIQVFHMNVLFSERRASPLVPLFFTYIKKSFHFYVDLHKNFGTSQKNQLTRSVKVRYNIYYNT